jgi:hypothetical protein
VIIPYSVDVVDGDCCGVGHALDVRLDDSVVLQYEQDNDHDAQQEGDVLEQPPIRHSHVDDLKFAKQYVRVTDLERI